MIKLIQGDCLEKMKKIKDQSIDMVLCDPPYGTTACKWDSVINLDLMWEQLKRITKPNGAIVLTASQPFTTTLISSYMKMFKYCWVWEKDVHHSPLNAPYQPLKFHEDVVVFSAAASTYSKKGTMKYYPQMSVGSPYKSNAKKKPGLHTFHVDPSKKSKPVVNKGVRYPRSVQKFNRETGLHPTQKPVALMEYLIKTYTLKGETVLDFAMGSGTTGVACKRLRRDFIGIELDGDYFEIAKQRIKETRPLKNEET